MGCNFSNEISSNKLIICTRHGERSDYAGLNPKLGKNDPELTINGNEQATLMGFQISEEILKRNIKGKIKILSSPFSRTLQTSKYILRSLSEKLDKNNLDNIIYVENNLCEYMEYSHVNPVPPKDYLALYNNKDFKDREFKNIQINLLNDQDVLPTEIETDDVCSNRIKNLLDLTLESGFNKDVDVYIFVSHGTPIDKLNQFMGYPGPFGYKKIGYCDSFIYNVDLANKKTEYIDRKTNTQSL
jgi:broad specificity phosphatase PhoE